MWIHCFFTLVTRVEPASDSTTSPAASTSGLADERLGHTQISVTMDIYSHVLPGTATAIGTTGGACPKGIRGRAVVAADFLLARARPPVDAPVWTFSLAGRA